MAGRTETLPPLMRLFGAFAAGVSGFALTACLLLIATMSEGLPLFRGWSIIASFVAVPAAVMALMPLSARLFCFGVGLTAMIATSFLDVSGGHNPMGFIPFTAVCLGVAAALAEFCVRVGRRFVRPKSSDRDVLGG